MKALGRKLLVAALAAAASAGLAQDRPSEGDLFGQPPAPAQGGAPKAPAGAEPPESQPGPTSAEPEDSRGEPRSGTEGRLGTRLGETDNPLQLGGQLYLRAFAFARQGQPPSDWLFTAPALVDGYLDARPSDRVRGFLLARMQYDPALGSGAGSSLGLPSLTSGTASPANPRVLLDQLWLRFDVEKTAFVTAGKQHVKWGTGRFWNPTDFLHAVRRDPLAVFDARTGTTMLRVHVPWERRGWNFYGIAIAEPLTAAPSTGALDPSTGGLGASAAGAPDPQQVGGIGGAARAEIVLGPSELGLGAVVQRGHRARFALDASAGVLDLDLYGEAALKTGSELPLYRERAGAGPGTPLLSRYEAYQPSGLTPAVTLGARWGHKYSDEDSLELGLEWFYQRTGYADSAVYPLLIGANAFTPFYLGRQYAGAYLLLPNPGSWNQTTFILSTLGNLSDRTFVTRLDYSVLVLTYLRFEAYGQVHYGPSAGEFRLGLSVPPQDLGNGFTTPSVALGASTFDLGVALRVSL